MLIWKSSPLAVMANTGPVADDVLRSAASPHTCVCVCDCSRLCHLFADGASYLPLQRQRQPAAYISRSRCSCSSDSRTSHASV
jgi:hypothetical protein